MKNVLLAGAMAAALALTGLSQQRASAQYCPPQCMRGGEISFNAGITLGCHWTPCHGHWEPNCCGPYGCPFGPYGYAGAPPYGYGPPGFAGARPPAPPAEHVGGPHAPPPPPHAPKEEQAAVQSIGYSYPAPYDYGYGYYYGYPYYQGADYGYGR